MTVIAWKNGVLATDGRITSDNGILINDNAIKIFELKKETVYYKKDELLVWAACGECGVDDIFENWLYRQDFRDSPHELHHDFEALIIGKHNIYMYSGAGMATYPKKDCLAIGSGYVAALALMKYGLSAKAAVEETCKTVLSCGGLIQEWLDPFY